VHILLGIETITQQFKFRGLHAARRTATHAADSHRHRGRRATVAETRNGMPRFPPMTDFREMVV